MNKDNNMVGWLDWILARVHTLRGAGEVQALDLYYPSSHQFLSSSVPYAR